MYFTISSQIFLFTTWVEIDHNLIIIEIMVFLENSIQIFTETFIKVWDSNVSEAARKDYGVKNNIPISNSIGLQKKKNILYMCRNNENKLLCFFMCVKPQLCCSGFLMHNGLHDPSLLPLAASQQWEFVFSSILKKIAAQFHKLSNLNYNGNEMSFVASTNTGQVICTDEGSKQQRAPRRGGKCNSSSHAKHRDDSFQREQWGMREMVWIIRSIRMNMLVDFLVNVRERLGIIC